MGKYDYDVNAEFAGSSEGLGIPFIGIRQKELKSADGKQILQAAGAYKYNDDTPDAEEITFVMLFSHPGRSHWLPGADLPDCKSNNNDTPLNPETAYCTDCNKCDEAVWHGSEKPACQSNLQMCILSYDEESDQFIPGILQVKGKGLKAGKACVDALKKLAKKNADTAPWHYLVKTYPKYVAEKGFTYYVNVFECEEKVTLPEGFIERIDEIRADLYDAWMDGVKVEPIGNEAPALTGRQSVGQLMQNNEVVVQQELQTTVLGGSDPFKLKSPPADTFDNE